MSGQNVLYPSVLSPEGSNKVKIGLYLTQVYGKSARGQNLL